MINVATKLRTPKSLHKLVFTHLLGVSFQMANAFDKAAHQSVQLDAKNTANFKKRDLAVVQIIDLAKTYGVTVVLV